ncbi:MAG: hypothetical protein HY841_05555 [Bacteroidetes bacterium]|nr:hypothetical protein [Bacteroidota bacterium]
MKSLRTFHTASSVTIQLHTLITEVEVLYKKGLLKAALKLLHHAKKLALHHEQHLATMQLLEWEVKLLSASHQLVRGQKKITNAFEESAQQRELYRNFQDCLRFRLDVSALHNKEIIIRKSKEAEEQKRFPEEIKKLSKKNLSGKAQWELYNGAGTYFSTIGNNIQSNVYHKKAALISKKKNFLLSDELRQYLLSLYTQGISYYYLKKYHEALGNLKIIRDVFASLSDTKNKKNIQELYFNVLLLEGFILMDTGKSNNALPLINELKKQVELHVSSINTSLRTDIYYQQTVFWFWRGDFKQALLWLNKLLQDEDAPKENPARFRFARLMQLLVLLELKEFEQIENLIPATRKFLRKKNQKYKIEEAILSFISAYIRKEEFHSDKYGKEKFSELKKKMLRLVKDKNEATAIRIFDYVRWCNAKIENKTMAEMN